MAFRKKTTILLTVTILAVAILGIRIVSSAQDNHNGILLFGSKQNAGTFKTGAEIHAEVRALNSGFLPVSISGTPDCGCTVSGDYDHTLLPLGSISIPLTISTKEMKEGPHSRIFQLDFKSGKTAWSRKAALKFIVAN